MLTIDTVSKQYGQAQVLHPVSFDLVEKEILCVLGPSGSGKSTLLKILAGAIPPTKGRIQYRGQPLDDPDRWPPEIVMVWQSMALFPHYSVGGNVGFGLAVRGMPRDERRPEVAKVLDLVELAGFEKRRVTTLSGGEQQRVALARALVLKPRLLLLDEPFGSLDAHLRASLVRKVREIRERFGLTMMIVTHDQSEAISLADRLVLLRAGHVEQIGTTTAVCREPRTGFVARFVGKRNVFSAEVTGLELGAANVKIGSVDRRARIPNWIEAGQIRIGARVAYVVESHSVRVGHGGRCSVSGTITSAIALDGRVVLEAHTAEFGTLRLERSGTKVEEQSGERVSIGWHSDDAFVVPESPRESEQSCGG